MFEVMLNFLYSIYLEIPCLKECWNVMFGIM